MWGKRQSLVADEYMIQCNQREGTTTYNSLVLDHHHSG